MLHLTPRTSAFQEWRDIMSFILKYPRRVYTHLFPSTPTWWLVLVLFILNGIDFISFEALNHSNPAITTLPAAQRNIDGLVQTIFIRSAGFTVISISSLRIGLQALYVPMMFISAFPVAITMRSSNVYEERSLGIYASELRAQPPSFTSLEASGSASLLTHTSRTRLYCTLFSSL
jgi:Trk-type K+ transport system membrane component